MAIHLKTPDDIACMRKTCSLAAEVLNYIEPQVIPGVTLLELNQLCHDFILKNGATPSPLGYKGFPASICTSVNDIVCHGIPDKTLLREGDIVNLDITTYLEGFHGDCSRTFLVGKCSRAARDLVTTAYEAMWLGIDQVKAGGFLGDIGEAIESYVVKKGYSVVREYCGHGIGRNFHEDPHVVHFGRKGTGARIKPGMVFTVEPMVNLGKAESHVLEDDWTVKTSDGKLSAQFEHTLAVWEDHIEVLTLGWDKQKLEKSKSSY